MYYMDNYRVLIMNLYKSLCVFQTEYLLEDLNINTLYRDYVSLAVKYGYVRVSRLYITDSF
jgi:hypothetical protein